LPRQLGSRQLRSVSVDGDALANERGGEFSELLDYHCSLICVREMVLAKRFGTRFRPAKGVKDWKGDGCGKAGSVREWNYRAIYRVKDMLL